MAKEGGSIAGNFLRWLLGFFKSLAEKTKELAPEIIQIVTNVKNFVDSPGCDFLTAVIPGTLDNWAQGILREYLPKLLDYLNTAKDIAEIADQNERMKAIVANLQASDQDVKDISYHILAAKLIQKSTDETWEQSIYLAEGIYKNPELLTA
jgi:hypothetical protein